MKNPIEFIKSIPREIVEIGSFAITVLLGAVYKILRQKQEKGVKITFSKICTEVLMSFFIAMLVYSVFDQWWHFNKFFTYMMSSLAGSMSSMFHNKIEELFIYGFDACKKLIDHFFKTKVNEQN